MAVVVGTPRSLERRAVSSWSREDSSTVRVRAARSEILAEKDSRVRETAWRMRSKMPVFCDSSLDFFGSSLPKRVVIIDFSLIGTAVLAVLAELAERIDSFRRKSWQVRNFEAWT